MIERGNYREEIRKGPWKAEEDEVLLKHVRKYGPRDWSSIRSKGLLHRTGKSCRLRWVNKLRPNLKNGCKFTGEEERIVIELQAQFGNKWARIATYLPGRTDNDVKNFWSSRQKRLARILQASASSSSSSSKSSSSKSLRTKPRDVLTATRDNAGKPMEIAPLRSWREVPDQPHRIPHLPDNSNTITPVVLPESEIPTSLLHEKPICTVNSQEFFPQIPQEPQSAGMSFLPEANDFLERLEDSSLFSTFETLGSITGLGETDETPFFELPGCFRSSNWDMFFDDFPTDMLDNVGSLASPPRP